MIVKGAEGAPRLKPSPSRPVPGELNMVAITVYGEPGPPVPVIQANAEIDRARRDDLRIGSGRDRVNTGTSLKQIRGYDVANVVDGDARDFSPPAPLDSTQMMAVSNVCSAAVEGLRPNADRSPHHRSQPIPYARRDRRCRRCRQRRARRDCRGHREAPRSAGT